MDNLYILTFDVEEWFHILDNPSTSNVTNWNNYEARIHSNIDKIIEFLINKKKKATFFCLGWVAKKYPEIIKKINEAGFQIGTHSHMHQLVYHQTKKEFKEDTEKSIKTIEDITGNKINIYRAPGFSITEKSLWAFQILAECGIEIDCSIFPSKRAHGGLKKINCQQPFILQTGDVMLKEFPINIFTFNGIKIVFSGGGYFRLFPYGCIKRMMEASQYVMSYFHYRDFDTGQPLINDLSLIRKFKSYYGINNAFIKFSKLIEEFDFIDLQEAKDKIDWNKAQTISLDHFKK